MSRYEGKPFVRLIECYILSAIDELPPVYEQKLVEMVPALKETYQVDGTWREVVAQVMEFPDSIDDELRGMWNHNVAIAAQKNQILSPEAFAQAVVDQNFSSDPDAAAATDEEE